MQTKSYSGRGGGGPLQQSALKHCQEETQEEEITSFFCKYLLNKILKSDL